MKICTVSIDTLNPAIYNPRTWDNKAEDNLKESISRFGFIDPIIVNSATGRENVVVGGHFRLHVAKIMGYKEIPVVHVNLPDIEKEKELNLRLNRNTGEWDFEKLKAFDMELLLDIGFDNSDLSSIWDEQLSVDDDNFNVEKELEEIKEPQTKVGDYFQLGHNRLICGDSTNIDTVNKLIGEDKANMLYIDFPYNINLDYNKGIGEKKSYGGKQTKDNKSRQEYKKFISAILHNALSVSYNDVHVFSWCDQLYIGLIQEIYEEHFISNKRVCLWIKNNQNATPQIAFNKVYEPCVYGIKGSPYLATSIRNFNEILNKEVGSGNRTLDDIFDLFDIWLVKRLAGQSYEHPTEKNPSLHEKPIRRVTKPGDIILDLCAGSGSTLIAADQLKRKAYLCEIEPVFCDLIIKRFEDATGIKAIKLNK